VTNRADRNERDGNVGLTPTFRPRSEAREPVFLRLSSRTGGGVSAVLMAAASELRLSSPASRAHRREAARALALIVLGLLDSCALAIARKVA
jgi:hypothetical protein